MIGDRFREVCERFPDRTAISRPSGERISYADLHRRVTSTAAGLAAHRIGPGDVVATSMRNSIEYTVLLLAIAVRGAAHLPLPPGDRDHDHTAVSPSLLVTGPAGAQPPPGPAGPLSDVTRLAIAQVAERGRDADPAPPAIEPDRPFRLLETSGSTGVPRLMRWSHRAAFGSAVEWSGFIGLAPSDVVLQLHTLDVHHGLEMHLLPALLTGCTLVLLDPEAAPAARLAAIRASRATVMSALPRQYAELVAAAEREPGPLRDLRLPLCGGGYLSGSVARQAHDTLGIRLRRIYGTTEYGIVLANLDDELQLHGAMRPVAGVEIRLTGSAGDDPARRYGEIECRREHHFTGYHPDRPGPVGEVGGWYRTGDLGQAHDRGIEVLGRATDAIVAADQVHFVADLEAELATRVGLGEVVVLPPTGDDPVLRVLARPAAGLAPSPVAAVTRTLADRGLAGDVKLTDRIPHTVMGKPDRPLIRSGWTAIPTVPSEG